MLNTVDVVLIIIIASFAITGLFRGFIKSIGFLISAFLSIFIAIHFYSMVALIFKNFMNINLANFIAYVFCFLVFNYVLNAIFSLISKIFDLPLINILNKFLGFLFGVIEGIFSIGIILFFASQYPFTKTFTDGLATQSFMVKDMVKISVSLYPFIPDYLVSSGDLFSKVQSTPEVKNLTKSLFPQLDAYNNAIATYGYAIPKMTYGIPVYTYDYGYSYEVGYTYGYGYATPITITY